METKIEEIWKPVPDFEGIYEVSDLGQFRTLARFKMGKNYPTKALQTSKCTNLYRAVCFYRTRNKTRNVFLAHRVVATVFVDNPNNYPLVNHKNGIKWDNRAVNLEWVTLSRNMTHASETGLLNPKRGESNFHARLTEDDVRSIRRMSDVHSVPITHIAKMYDMGQTIIWMIVKRRKWSHII